MSNQPNKAAGLSLSTLQWLVNAKRDTVRAAESARVRARAEGDAKRLRIIDENLVGVRFDLAETLLLLSMKRRDAGDHQGALDAARLFAEQEHLAKTTRDQLAGVSA